MDGVCSIGELLRPTDALFPYTTLFRSRTVVGGGGGETHRGQREARIGILRDRRREQKSTRLNSSHQISAYAVFCVKKDAAVGDGVGDRGQALIESFAAGQTVAAGRGGA